MISTVMSPEKKGTLLAVASGLLYGLLGYFGMKILNSGLSVYNLSFWRFVIASLFMACVFFAGRAKGISLRQHLEAMLVGSIFYTIPGVLFFIASKLIGTGQAMVIFFVYPAFVMVINWLVNKQPIKRSYCWSFLVILVGLVLLVDLSELSFDLMGISLSLLSALSYAIYLFLSKKATIPAINSTFMVSLGCAAMAFCLGLIDNSLTLPTETMQWVNILGIGIVCSAVPILLLLEAMKHIPSDKASLLSVLEPVFTVIFGVILLGEVMNLNNVIGIILILVGAMSISVKSH